MVEICITANYDYEIVEGRTLSTIVNINNFYALYERRLKRK